MSDRDRLAEDSYKSVPWQYVNNMSFHHCYTTGFKNGYGARDAEIARLKALVEKADAERQKWKLMWVHRGARVRHWANKYFDQEDEVARLTQEVDVLRQYGNKTCTAMADEQLAALRSHRDGEGV